MKKFARRGIVLLLAVVMTLSFSVTKLRAAEPSGGQGTKPTDVVIVLDNSYSMANDSRNKTKDGKGSDPDKFAIQCADAFFTTSPVGSAIGLITFSNDVDKVANGGDLLVNNGQDPKASWDDLYTQKGVNTNITKALEHAAQMLIDKGTNPNKAIILITDGTNTGDPFDVKAVQEDNGDTIPVYCIFINGGENEDEAAARKFLDGVASQTGTGTFYEVNSAKDIQTTMEGIGRTIYETPDPGDGNSGSTSVEPGQPFVKIITIPDEVYEFSCTIEHDPNASFDLTVTDPSGKVIYENKTPQTKYVTGSDDAALTSLKILLPDPGDYTFEMVSDQEQEIKWSTIQIDAALDLSLDKSAIDEGADEEINATFSVKGNTTATVLTGNIRIHNDAGDIIENSADSVTKITKNSEESFTFNVKDLQAGIYKVYAIADMSDGKQRASVFKTFEVKGAASNTGGSTAGNTGATNEPPAGPEESKHKLPLIPIIIGAVVLLAAAGFVIWRVVAAGGGDKEVLLSPAPGTLMMQIKENGQLISALAVQLPMGLYGGKPRNLYEILKQETEWKNGDVSRIPQEAQEYWLNCTGPKNGPENLQKINIVDKQKRLLMQVPYNGTANFEVREGVQISFRWSTLKKRG